MKVNSGKFLLRILNGLGYAVAVIISYLVFSILLLQMLPYIGDYISQSPIDVFMIGLAIFAFASGFLRRTIFKYFVDGGRDIFLMGMAVYTVGSGTLSLALQDVYIEVDASIMLTLFLLATIIDLARTALSALSHLAEKEET